MIMYESTPSQAGTAHFTDIHCSVQFLFTDSCLFPTAVWAVSLKTETLWIISAIFIQAICLSYHKTNSVKTLKHTITVTS